METQTKSLSLDVEVVNGVKYFVCPFCRARLAFKPYRRKDVFFIAECSHFKVVYLALADYLKLVREGKVAFAYPYRGVWIAIVARGD